MRRVMFTVAVTVLMAGAVPASALAHHHSRHHARSHHAKIRRFGDQNTAPTSTSSSDNAGKVVDFSNGVLTIQLNDNSTVKGAVTNDTELECTAPQQSSTMTHEDGDGGSGSGGDNQGSGGDNQASGGQTQGDDDQAENQQGDDQGEDQNQNQSSSCSTSNLTRGTMVHDASLRIGGSGAVWQKVELVS